MSKPKGKVRLQVLIDEEVYRMLWERIRSKYPGSTYGALSREVQEAIAHFLSCSTSSTPTTSQPASPPSPPSMPSTSREEKKVEPMTDRQREYIKSLLKKVAAKLQRGYEELAEDVRRELGFDPREGLTKDQASKVIEWLESRLSA
ncbi:MAG: phage protein GemA/Gp16 family protein [Thermofilaceae archaeon]